MLRSAGVLAAAGTLGVALPTLPAVAQTAAGSLPLTTDPVVHALRRLSYGATPTLLARVRQVGVSAWLEEQLRPELLSDAECDAVLAKLPGITLTPAQVRAQFDDGAAWQVQRQLRSATMARRVWSQRQVLELMVEFWSDHFCIYPGDGPTHFYKASDDRDVIRPHALGSFAAMLPATAASPAMLYFLNNEASSADNLNENYGRELLELHTVGVDGGYTEADVVNAARVFTGWTVDRTSMTFKYVAGDHFVGPVSVLGWSHANPSAAGGLEVGRSLLSYLARHPATAQHLATKLCRRLVADEPPAALVASTAAAYLAADTQIKPVLRHLVASSEFAASVGSKLRRPAESYAGMLRAVGAKYDHSLGTTGADTLVWPLQKQGHSPFEWHHPDGYPDTSAAWLGTGGLLGRWNTALAVAGGWWEGLEPQTPLQLLGGATRPQQAGQIVDALCERLVQQRFPQAHRNALLTEVRKTETQTMSDNDLSWQGVKLVALILSSPYFQVR